MRPKPLILIILDGWGYSDNLDGNAIKAANTPFWDQVWEQKPHTLISGSGRCVGLPHGQMGNSEVGHLNMGAGRIVYQELTRIDKEIAEGSFRENPVLDEAVQQSRDNKLHIFGLVSPGGVHSHENHIAAMIEMAAQKGHRNIYLHAFLDGRDTPPKSAEKSLQRFQDLFEQNNCGAIATVIGRYYAMDRDQRWDRVAQAYHALTNGEDALQAKDAVAALHQAYQQGQTDEFVKPTCIDTPDNSRVEIGDTIVFMNFRADRARQLTRAFTEPNFTEFPGILTFDSTHFITLTEYARDLNVTVAYPPEALTNVLGEYLSNQGLTQLRIAETEKYAHVTFFFNGGREQPFPGEQRILIPSPKVATYDLQPEMSASEITDRLVEQIEQQSTDVIICNFANADMVGHTGDMQATIKAIEVLDQCLQRIAQALERVGGEALITADHGNAERMFDTQTHQPHTAHTNLPVPLIYLGRKAKLQPQGGKLSDIAPTLLALLGLPQPKEMTGHSLITLYE